MLPPPPPTPLELTVFPLYLVAVLLHAEVGTPVLHKHVVLHEGVLVQQQLDPLPRRQFTLQQEGFRLSLPCNKKSLDSVYPATRRV